MGIRLFAAASLAALAVAAATPAAADPDPDAQAAEADAGEPAARPQYQPQHQDRIRRGGLSEDRVRRQREERDAGGPGPAPVPSPPPPVAWIEPVQSGGPATRATAAVLRGGGEPAGAADRHRDRSWDRDDDRHDRRDWDRDRHADRGWDNGRDRDRDRHWDTDRRSWDQRDWRDPSWGDRSWQNHYSGRGWRRDWYDQRWSGGWDGTWGYGYQAWRFPGWGWNQGWSPGWNGRGEPPNSWRGFYNNGGVWVPSPWVWDRALRGARRYPVLVYRSWRDPRPDVRLDRSARIYWLADRAEWVFLRGVNRRYWYDHDRCAYYTRDDDGSLILLAVAPRDIGLGYALTVGSQARY